jgi:transposase
MTNVIRAQETMVQEGRETIGLDLSDHEGTYVVLDAVGEVRKQGKVKLSTGGLLRVFGGRTPALIALEVGTHSPWVERELKALGHETLVANARQVGLISKNRKKNDREDAERLARLARSDPRLLAPIQHRGVQAQADLAVLRSRDSLVRSRTLLINHVRGAVKSVGGRLGRCSADSFAVKMREQVPASLQAALLPLLDTIMQMTVQLKELTRQLEKISQSYPETRLLRQVKGVGLLTSLGMVLVLEDPGRFRKSRQVGAYLGLTTRQHASGDSDPQLHITKAGDEFLRRLLVQSAHYVLGPFGPDTDLRRWGLKLAGQGNKIRRRKAIIAVARKLAVLLHRLWSTGEVYEPLRGQSPA